MSISFIRKIWYRINPKHKDRLFCTMYGREKYKKYALELYNALNSTHYTRLSDLEIITLEDVVYIKMKNDVAYLINGNIAIYEHQSSPNPNMPLRGFMYLGELYSKILKRSRVRIYNNTQVKIPTPQYIVFYNGTEDYPECSKQKLSDAFINPRNDNDFEFTATVYNINYGKNKELLEACKSLKGYSFLIKKIREYSQNLSVEHAVDKAVQECIEKDILADVLSEERSAVMLEMLTTFDEKLYEEGLREEAWAKGLSEGRAKGREQGRAEGRAEERLNTDRERQRAEIAEAALAEYKAENERLLAELDAYRRKNVQ